jgi:hypothetical protein
MGRKKRITPPSDESDFVPATLNRKRRSVIKDDREELTELQKSFITAYVTSGGLTKVAIERTKITREILEAWKASPVFTKSLAYAEEDWMEELRKSALMRAMHKSDMLAMFMLKSFKPEKYDDDVRSAQYVGNNSQLQNVPVRATLIRDNQIHLTIKQQEESIDIDPAIFMKKKQD